LGKETAHSRTCTILAVAAGLLASAAPCFASPADIEYLLTHLTGDRWQYSYTVTNESLAVGIEEITLWFAFDKYENLAITTPDPPSSLWDEIIVQPEPLLLFDGYYDALTLGSGIPVGQSVGGFSVAFDWLGAGTPSPQPFDIVDPDTFEALHTGTTTPEPGPLVLLGLLSLLRRRRR
jgi:MYXO-CTERM domain-containing protein